MESLSLERIYRYDFWTKDGVPTSYGFPGLESLAMTLHVVGSVNGVGPMSWYKCLSKIAAFDQWETLRESPEALASLPGIPKKSHSAVYKALEINEQSLFSSGSKAAAIKSVQKSRIDEVKGGLVSLGYKASDALKSATQVVNDNPDDPIETLIRKALTRS